MSRKQIQLTAHKVSGVENVVNNVYILKFEKQFNFIPGQVVAIGIDEEHEPRLYSIASGINGDEMKVLFDVYPDGFLTPRLSQLKKGDVIFVSEPFGKFVASGGEEWWIATGTGIAPFVSRLESDLQPPQKLLHGSRLLDHFYYQDFLHHKLSSKYYRFCTKESSSDVISGRLTNWLKEQKTLPKGIKYYLCGNPEMVVEVRDIILSKGVEFENIMAEIYF